MNTELGKSLCNFAGITSDNADLGGGSIDTQLGKSLCNFAGITPDNVDPWVYRGSIDTQVWKSLCNFAGITSDNVDPVEGLIDTHLGRSLGNFAGITCDNVDPGWRVWSALNLGSHFATLLWLPLTMLILGRGSIDTKVVKSLCNFAVITSDNVDPGDGQSILNLGSHFATWLGLPQTMLILGGSIEHSSWEVTLQLCWDYLWQCWSRGLIDTQLGRSLCNFAGITSDHVDPGWGVNQLLNLGSHFATLLGLSLTMLILGGWSIDTQLGKSLCNFAGITSENVDPGAKRSIRHSTWKVTLQLCWDYLCQCWSWGVDWTLNFGKSLCNFAGITSDNVDPGGLGGQSTFNLGSYFATLLRLLLTMLILGAKGSINTQLGKSLCNFAGITSDNVDPRGSIDTQLGKSLCNSCWDYLWQCWCWGCVVNQTLNLGSHSGTLLGLPLTMLILGVGGSIDNQLGKSLCNLCWDYFWQCWSWWCVVDRHSTWEVTL